MRTVMIIDDEPDIVRLMTLVLEREGYAVVSAFNGRDALVLIERGMPDLILLDMKMPIMDGWEFARRFNHLYGKACPIYVVSAAEDIRARVIEIDAEGFLAKPFDLLHLSQAVLGALAPLPPKDQPVAPSPRS